MSNLEPRPNKTSRNYSWGDLNAYLQSHLSNPATDYALVDLRNYVMDKPEIVTELERNGYTVSDYNEHNLKVE